MKTIGIAGASGYVGAELIRLLSAHAGVKITYLASESCAGQGIDSAFQSLAGSDLPLCEVYDPHIAADRCDVIFLVRSGFGESAPELLSAGVKIISVPGDFRFRDPEVYREWYGKPHPAPSIADQAIYGLTELRKEEIGAANLIANPGCYPTASILAIAPLVKNKLIDLKSIVIDAKSGVSGAGRTRLEQGYLYAELEQNVRAYRVASHQHTPEIEQELSDLAEESVTISFTPHLIPMTRGLLATCYALLNERISSRVLGEAFREFYRGQPFIVILPEGEYPATKNTLGSNFCHIGLEVDGRTGRVIVMSAIDNLGKGAAGQAVQNMNVMLGFEETAGLTNLPVYP